MIYKNNSNKIFDDNIKCLLNVKRICLIEYEYDGKRYNAEVGHIETWTGEVVLSIVKGSKLIYLCTPNNGVKKGTPILIDREKVFNINYFSQN
ncbi:MAG: hypothetical protein ABI550_00010 [Ignavibacteriaceae bacterium]